MISDIRTKIVEKLDELVTAGTLGQAISDAFKYKLLDDTNITAYPVAILQTPYFESEELDNATNKRTYTYEIRVVMNGDDVESASDVENLQEAVANAFDDDFTLAGSVDGGLSPASTPVVQYEHNGKHFISFNIILKAEICYNISN